MGRQVAQDVLASNPISQSVSRWISILKIALFCMPFLYLGYLGLGTGGADTADVLQLSPTVAVSFLCAMIQPYAAWILILSERKLKDGRNEYAVCNLLILLIAELMMMSTVGVIGFGLVLWQVCRKMGANPLTLVRQMRANRLFAEVGGSVVVLILAGVCLFATLQIGM